MLRESIDRERLIQRQLARASFYVRLVDLAGGLAVWLIGVLVLFIAAAIFDHWIGLGTVGRFVALALLLGGSFWHVTMHVAPLVVRAINPAYAAKTIEAAAPTLKNSLINFLLLRQDKAAVREVVYQAVEKQAAADISSVAVESTIDRTRLIHAGYCLCAVMAILAAYKILSPKDPFQTVARVLAPWAIIARPSRVQISEIEPGNAEFYHGQSVPVGATIRGLRANDKVQLRFTTADGQIVEQPVEMKLAAGDRYECVLPPADSAAYALSSGLQQNVVYRVLAGDAESQPYRLTVLSSPTIIVDRLELAFPAYTKRPPETIRQQGDIRALEGTKVTLHAVANQPIRSAWLEMDPATGGGAAELINLAADGDRARGQLTLLLRPDRQTPWHASYQVRYHNQRSEKSLHPILHKLDVLRDLAPEVQIVQPERLRVEVPEDGELPLVIRGVDPDFGLASLRLEGSAGGKPPVAIELLPEPASHPPQFTAQHAFRPREHQLKTGEVFVYFAVADDNRTNPRSDQPEPNTARTKEYQLVVTAPRNQGSGGSPDAKQPPNPKDRGNPAPGEQPRPPEQPPERQRPMNGGGQNQPGDKAAPNQQPEQQPKQDQPARDRQQPENSQQKSGSQQSGNQQSGNQQSGSDKSGSQQSGKQPSGQQQPGEQQSGEQQSGKQQSGNQQSDGTPQSDGQQPNNPGESGQSPNSQQSGGQQSKGQEQGNQPGQEPNNSGQPGGQQTSGQQNSGQSGTNQSGKSAGNQPNSAQPNSPTQPNNSPQPNNNQGEREPGGTSESPPNPGDGQGKAGHDGQAIERIFKELQKRQQQSGDQPSEGGAPPNQPESGSAPSANSGQSSNKSGRDPQSGQPSAPENSSPGEASGQPGKQAGGSPNGNQPQPSDKPQPDDQASQGQQPDQQPAAGDKAGQSGSRLPDEKQGQNPSEQPGSGSKGGAPQGPDKTDKGSKSPTGKGEKRDPGAGDNGDEGDGKASDDKSGSGPGARKNADRNKDPSQESSKAEGGESSPQSDSKRQSNSKGGTSGERSGGGSQGAGQSAGQEGNDSAGSKSAADQGAGKANESGKGETGTKAGDQQPAAGKTGQAGTEKGAGSGSRKGDEQAGSSSPEGGADRGEPGAGKGQPPAGDQAKSAPVGGTDGGRERRPTPSAPEEEMAADEANLSYARKATDMVLRHLKDEEHNPDPELLDKLGWTRDDLAEFLRRWDALEKSANQSPAGKREFDEALRSLGLRDPANRRRAGGTTSDNQRDLRDAGNRTAAPPRYRDLFDAFRKGAARTSP